MLLSIGMMVKNEEKYLEECLQGLKPILDAVDSELIIVDTGSTDRTVEIAKKYTNRVYHHEWTGHFGEMRNTVLKYARGQWFFFIDADEIIDDYTDIVNFFTSKRHKKANAAFFLLKNLLSSGNNDSYGYAHMLRFFRKDKEFHFRGAIHEQPVYKLPVAHIKASAVHYGYLNDDAGLMEYKYERNVEILENELEKDPENVYYWFQLAQSCGMYGDKDKSLDAILKAYRLMKADKKPTYRMSIYIHLAKCYFDHGMHKKVIDVCNEGCRLREGYFDLYYFRAVSRFELGDFEDALKSFEQYLEGVERFRKNKGLVDLSVPYITVHFYDHALHCVSVIYKKLGDYQKSLEYADKINDKAVYNSVIPHVVEIYMEQERFEDLKILYETKVAEDGDFDEVFLYAFEGYRRKMGLQQKELWSKLFAGEPSGYGLLNRIRLLDDTDSIAPALVDRVMSLDWNKVPVFYGELIWALIRRNIAIIPVLKDLQEYRFNALLEHMVKNSRRFASILLDYIKGQGLWRSDTPDPETLRVKVIMLRSILVFDGLSKTDYEEAFDEYIADGIANLKNLYNRDVIENKRVSFMKTNADALMLYMYKAKECFQNDKVSYVRYLREALNADNQMKKGIQILQERISERIRMPQDELEQHKRKVLETIENAINMGDIEAAQALISEYESIVGVDAKICSAKSIILMLQQQWDQAKKVLLEGLKLNDETPDLLFNLGYLYEQRNEYKKAVSYYQLARENTGDETLKNEIDSILKRIGEKHLDTCSSSARILHRKKLLIIAHIFPPVGGSGVQRTLKFVKYLRDTGWEPVVVTVGKTVYPLKDYSLVAELPGDIKLVRIDEEYSVNKPLIGNIKDIMQYVTNNKELVQKYAAGIEHDEKKLRAFCTTPDSCLIWANSVINNIDKLIDMDEIDAVYTTSGPYSDHLVGYCLKKKYKFPWIADFRDEWTNNPFARYDKSSLRYKIEYAMESSILNAADRVIVTTPLARRNYINGFNLTANKIISITNGYDEEDFIGICADIKCKDRFTILHNGLLYSIRTPITFFKALSEAIKDGLINRDKISIDFTWTENDQLWIDYAEKFNIKDCVNFIGYLDHEDCLRKAMNADCLLLILGPGQKNKAVYPGKIFEYLRLGKPVLGLSPKGGLVEQLIREHNIGLNSDFEDIKAIKRNLVDLYTKWNAGKLTVDSNVDKIKVFERCNLTKKLAEVLYEACSVEK